MQWLPFFSLAGKAMFTCVGCSNKISYEEADVDGDGTISTSTPVVCGIIFELKNIRFIF